MKNTTWRKKLVCVQFSRCRSRLRRTAVVMDLLGSILSSMDAPPTSDNKKAKGWFGCVWGPRVWKW